MLLYSRRGLRDWVNMARPDLQAIAMGCLFNSVAESEWECHRALDGRPEERKFIPMPRRGYKGFEWCFFLPITVKGTLKSLTLFIIVNRAKKNCVALRFEGSTQGAHGYAHVQFTSNFGKSGLIVPAGVVGHSSCLLEWLPVSYPAIPVPARSWMEMFLAMMTAVHGRLRRCR